MTIAPVQTEHSQINLTTADIFLELAANAGQEAPAEELHRFKKEKRPLGNPRFWAIADFNQPSNEKRLYVFDTREKTVSRFFVAHGKGSDAGHDGTADKFSNEPGSNCTSLGIYRCSETYEGGHGYSMRLDGLEESNSKARARNIVMHQANYVSEDHIEKHGVLGRSEGCFAVENSVSETLIDQLKGGSYVIAWKTVN